MKLIDRVMWAHENLEFPKPNYSIVWERADGGVSVTSPSGEFLAMAMHGGLLPDIEMFHQMRCRWVNDAGEEMFTLINEGPGPGWKEGKVMNAELMHEGPRAPKMTEEEAMEYLLQKDVPRYVWADHETANRKRFYICPRECVPKNRAFRNHWQLKSETQLEQAA